MLTAIRIFAVAAALLLASLAHATGIAGVEFDKTTRADFTVQAKHWATKASPVSSEDGYALQLDSATIDGTLYSVLARFDGTRVEAPLRELVLTAKGKPKTAGELASRYSVLKTFSPSQDDPKKLVSGEIIATAQVVNGKDVLTFQLRQAAWVSFAVFGTLGLAGLWFVYGLCHQFFSTVLTTVIFGALTAGFGPLSAILFVPVWAYFIWGYTRKGRVYSHAGGGEAGDPMAINPANGQPMIGGMGGMDTYGNTYGSNFNDPHL